MQVHTTNHMSSISFHTHVAIFLRLFFSHFGILKWVLTKKISIANTYQICVQKLFSILLKNFCKIALMLEYAIHF